MDFSISILRSLPASAASLELASTVSVEIFPKVAFSDFSGTISASVTSVINNTYKTYSTVYMYCDPQEQPLNSISCVVCDLCFMQRCNFWPLGA